MNLRSTTLKLLLSISFFLVCNFVCAQDEIVDELKKHLPGISIEEMDAGQHFNRVFKILIDQPLDHQNPSAGTFQQKIYLSHVDKKAPNVIATEGYSCRYRVYEPTEFLQANQIQVEYRFFGESKPENYDYKYLTNEQAMDDLHRIRTLLGKIYCKKWLSTGISKGGTTTLIYKATYPEDVEVAFPYVAPLPMAREDKRCDENHLSRGTEDCRNRLEHFQREILKDRDQIIPWVDSLRLLNNMTFDLVGLEEAFEYAVLEFTF